MHLFRETFLLFSLNLLDALLTIIWVRNGVATEGNNLMARLLDSGDFTFLSAKIAIGTITALVLLRWGNRSLAKYGLTLALAVYISLDGHPRRHRTFGIRLYLEGDDRQHAVLRAISSMHVTAFNHGTVYVNIKVRPHVVLRRNTGLMFCRKKLRNVMLNSAHQNDAIMPKKERNTMASKAVYQMSARQIVLLAFAAAVIAVGATALLYSFFNFFQAKDQSMFSFAESAPQGISDPNAVTDEQNSIEVYKSISPGVAFINTTSVRESYLGNPGR